MEKTYGHSKYIVSEELHASGKKHYHAYYHFDKKLDCKDVKCFDIEGVHPNIIRGPKQGWIEYVAKDKNFETNFYAKDPCMAAMECDTWQEASDILWEKMPKWMLEKAAQVEKNFKRRKTVPHEPRIYYGPYIKDCIIGLRPGWNMNTQSLEVVGPPGIGKTQWAKYFCNHHGGFFYCKGTLECLKHYSNESWIIFDDVEVDLKDCNALLDVEAGGSIPARYYDSVLPGGVKRIFLHNGTIHFTGHTGAIDRRKFTINLPHHYHC